MSVRIIAVTGLRREAAALANLAVQPIASGGNPAKLQDRLLAALSGPVDAIISIGLGGGLDPSLLLGDAVIATVIQGPSGCFKVDEDWSRRLSDALTGARRGVIVGSDQILASAKDKADLRQRTGGLCVDMESHVAAALAFRSGLPFAALRFISDAADRTLPPAALKGMADDGSMDVAAVLRALLADPSQLPSLLKTGRDAEIAFKALFRGCRRLGPTLGFADI